MGSQVLGGTRLLMEYDHSGGAWQMDEHTLGCFLVSSDGAVGLKDIGVGSPREILPAVWVYRTGGISKDSGWMGSMNRGLEKYWQSIRTSREELLGTAFLQSH